MLGAGVLGLYIGFCGVVAVKVVFGVCIDLVVALIAFPGWFFIAVLLVLDLVGLFDCGGFVGDVVGLWVM